MGWNENSGLPFMEPLAIRPFGLWIMLGGVEVELEIFRNFCMSFRWSRKFVNSWIIETYAGLKTGIRGIKRAGLFPPLVFHPRPTNY